MNRNIYVSIFVIALLVLSACKKSQHIDPDAAPVFAHSYLPLNKNNNWTYLHTTNNITNTIIATVTYGGTPGGTDQVYHGIYVDADDVLYYFQNKNLYVMSVETGTIYLSTPVLDENQSDGYTVITKDLVNISTLTPPFATFTMKESITGKIINSKTYNNVIHTRVDIEEAPNGIYTNVVSYDFYFARDIGIVELDKSKDGVIFDTRTIVSYNVY